MHLKLQHGKKLPTRVSSRIPVQLYTQPVKKFPVLQVSCNLYLLTRPSLKVCIINHMVNVSFHIQFYMSY